MLEYPFEIRKQSATEEAEEPEPQSKARDMTVTDLTKGLELNEDAVKVFEEVQCDDVREAASRQGIMGMLAMRRF